MWPFITRKEIEKELHESEQRMLAHLIPVDQLLVQIKQLFPEPQQKPGELRLMQLPGEVLLIRQHLNYLQKQLEKLAEVHTLVSQLASITPDGKRKRIHPDIDDHIQNALRAVEAIGQTHANWLEDYVQRVGATTKLMQEEADKHNQGQVIVEQLMSDMQRSDTAAAD
jgi:hypothetical protein